ncbi:hypothetical protein H5410_022012, partial [Solanum commersonii]
RHCQRSDRWPTLHAGVPRPKPPLNSATTFNKVEDKITMPIPIKDITYIHGNPTVLWEEEEVQIMIIKEELQYAITEIFSYGWSNLEKIRKLILYGVRFKSKFKEGFLSNRHILIRLTNMKDYTDIISDVTSKVETLVQPRRRNYPHMDLFFIPITKSRPSFVKVKVEVDLLKEFLKRINVGVKKTYLRKSSQHG